MFPAGADPRDRRRRRSSPKIAQRADRGRCAAAARTASPTPCSSCIAGMLGVGLDDLKQREAQRAGSAGARVCDRSVAGMMITSALATTAWLARNEAERQTGLAETEAETARQTTRFMVDLFKVSDPERGAGQHDHGARDPRQGRGAHRDRTRRPARDPGDADGHHGHRLHEPRALRHGDPADARVARASASRSAGDTTAEIAETLSHLGEALMLNWRLHRGDAAAAARRSRSSAGARQDAAPKSRNTLSALADVMSFTGEYDKAQPLIEEALRIRRKPVRRHAPLSREEPR